MEDGMAKDYIARIVKASTYFAFRNGPAKKLHSEGKLTDKDVKEIQIYMQNHLAYLFNVLLEENNLKKLDLIVTTMDKFYINDEEKVQLDDDGFDNFYNNLFNKTMDSINIKK